MVVCKYVCVCMCVCKGVCVMFGQAAPVGGVAFTTKKSAMARMRRARQYDPTVGCFWNAHGKSLPTGTPCATGAIRGQNVQMGARAGAAGQDKGVNMGGGTARMSSR